MAKKISRKSMQPQPQQKPKYLQFNQIFQCIQSYKNGSSSGTSTLQQQHWRDEERMITHVMDRVLASRRMKEKQFLECIEYSIAALGAEDAAEQMDKVSFSSEDESMIDEEEQVAMMEVNDTNFFNRNLAAGYAVKAAARDAANVTTEDNSAKIQVETPEVEQPSSKRPLKVTVTKSKKLRTLPEYAPPNVRYADLGGIEHCIQEVRELIEAPMRHPEIYMHLNIEPPRGILLHGPPGCGKTQLARAVAGELDVPFIQISAPSIVSGMSEESEKKIREIFQDAADLAPCLLFLDEIDAITPKRETAQREMERRIVAQLLTCMNDLTLENTNNKPVIVIGATNRPDSIDEALRRAGRFDREICMGIPDEKARESILKVMTSKLQLSGDFDYKSLAKVTPGYVGADLKALTTAAGVLSVKRIFGALADKPIDDDKMADDSISETQVDQSSEISRFLARHPDPLTAEQLAPLSICMDDFVQALSKVQPSSKREGFTSVPGVTWSDIGALSTIRDELRMSITEPVKHPEMFARVGINGPSGVLLWGPPGCGKTLLAKAVANESHCNFISVKGPELLNKYVGESERGVRQVFSRARASAPCVIFFDELDALCPSRGAGSDSQTSERVVNQLLTELDGIEGRKDVYVIGATNRPDIIDRAMLRGGRFNKLLYVQLPTEGERYEIIKTISAKVPIAEDVDLKNIVLDKQCERFSGADLSSLLREAGYAALREAMSSSREDVSLKGDVYKEMKVYKRHFETALGKVSASVTEKDLLKYTRLVKELGMK